MSRLERSGIEVAETHYALGDHGRSEVNDAADLGTDGERIPSTLDVAVNQDVPPRKSHSLPLPLRILFSFNGASFVLPSLALMSIVNDRAAIPPEYLPAYGAISFLPWSIKPLYVYLSNFLTRRYHLLRCHTLIALLLAVNGLSFAATAAIPPDGVILCFVCGFVRGIASSWPELLLDLTLIDTARNLSVQDVAAGHGSSSIEPSGTFISEEIADTNNDTKANTSTRAPAKSTPLYQEIATFFQAQAATSRNIGSLSAGAAAFLLYAWRHYHNGKNNDDSSQPELSYLVVTAILLVTAALPLFGSVIAFRYKVGSVINDTHTQRSQARGDYYAVGEDERVIKNKAHNFVTKSSLELNGERDESLVKRSRARGDYNVVDKDERAIKNKAHDFVTKSPLELNDEGDESLAKPPQARGDYNTVGKGERAINNKAHDFVTKSPVELNDGGDESLAKQKRIQYELKEHKCYAATLIFFQIVLIFASMKGPLIAVTSHVVWLSILVVVSLCLVVSMSAASFYERRKNRIDQRDSKEISTQIQTKRVALYLLLRHSLPSSGYIFYSFLFTLFESSPLFMQILSLLGSAGATCSSWFYGKYLAKKYSSGWSLLWIIVATSIIYSLTSLFNMFIYRLFGGSDDEGQERSELSMLLVVAPIYFLTGVVAELNFMPSLVIATTNIVADSDKTAPQITDNEASSADSNDGIHSTSTEPSPFDEGMQYAGFVSCIDFGEQVGSWLTVPIASALDITREDSFANLDRLILLCSSIYLISLVYLYLIRPGSMKKKNDVDMSVNEEVDGEII